MDLVGFVDFNWTRELDKRKSTTNMLFKVGCNLISWSNKLQPTIALSTIEVEYHSLANATKEITSLKALLIKRHYLKGLTKLFCDNMSNIKLVSNRVHHVRTTHIELQHHYIKERFELDEIKVEYTPTNQQEADLLTKPLGGIKFQTFRTNIGIEDYS